MNKLFKAFSDPTRREILHLLKDSDMTAGEIADKFNISKPSISHHLDILKNVDLITAEKKGQYVVYSINLTTMQTMTMWFMDFVEDDKED